MTPKPNPAQPIRPGTDDEADANATPDELAVIRERMKTFERDAAAGSTWQKFKATLPKPRA